MNRTYLLTMLSFSMHTKCNSFPSYNPESYYRRLLLHLTYDTVDLNPSVVAGKLLADKTGSCCCLASIVLRLRRLT